MALFVVGLAAHGAFAFQILKVNHTFWTTLL
jgi:hypothetical protein